MKKTTQAPLYKVNNPFDGNSWAEFSNPKAAYTLARRNAREARRVFGWMRQTCLVTRVLDGKYAQQPIERYVWADGRVESF